MTFYKLVSFQFHDKMTIVNKHYIHMQWQIQGRGPRGPVPLVFRPNWGPKGTTTPPPLTKGLDDWASPLFEGMDPPLHSLSLLQCRLDCLNRPSSFKATRGDDSNDWDDRMRNCLDKKWSLCTIWAPHKLDMNCLNRPDRPRRLVRSRM